MERRFRRHTFVISALHSQIDTFNMNGLPPRHTNLGAAQVLEELALEGSSSYFFETSNYYTVKFKSPTDNEQIFPYNGDFLEA